MQRATLDECLQAQPYRVAAVHPPQPAPHWAQQLGLRQTDTGELVAILDPAESRARSRRAREKSVFVPPAPKPAPDEVEDADDSSARRAACPT